MSKLWSREEAEEFLRTYKPELKKLNELLKDPVIAANIKAIDERLANKEYECCKPKPTKEISDET